MNKKLLLFSFPVLFCAAANAMPLEGFYKTIDDKTGNAKSIVRLYECREIGDNDLALCGRIVALYDANGEKITETLSKPVRIADAVKGSPNMVGLDILWNMEWDEDDSEYEDGKILDPKTGKIYSSVAWQDNKDSTKLNVRGKIGPFGRTQVWHAVDEKDLPADLQKLDIKNWTPKIIK